MNKTADYQFTITVPVYNEAESLAALEACLAEFLPRCIMKACVLLVNDCSTDSSLELIKDICARRPDFYYVSHPRRLGLSGALKTAFDAAESDYIGYIDADLQTVPEDFNLLLEHAADYPLVTGVRAARKDTIGKKIQSRIGNGWRRMMTGDGARDTGCPLKVLQRNAARQLPMFNGMHRFIPALVLLQDGGCYKEVPVRHRERAAGKSKFNMFNRLRGFTDCFIYRWMRRNWVTINRGENNLG
ncbi:MAG: glycosyltransferase family 2 protein [Bacteroidales bacterium]|nr:glycosyltransferase family 2 protein [Bacteroidales bacterium]